MKNAFTWKRAGLNPDYLTAIEYEFIWGENENEHPSIDDPFDIPLAHDPHSALLGPCFSVDRVRRHTAPYPNTSAHPFPIASYSNLHTGSHAYLYSHCVT
jgi:hypothetical protein